MLLNFVALNYTGFDKIMKTFDKHAGVKCRKSVRKKLLQQRNFVCSLGSDDLLDQAVSDFALFFEEGDNRKAEVRLLSKMTQAQYGSRDMFRFGFKSGITFTLTCFAVYFLAFSLNTSYFKLYHSGFYPAYRGIGCALCFAWMWGLNIFIWERYRINFVYLMEINPRNRLSYHQMLEEASNMSIVFLINLTLLLSHVHLVPEHWQTTLQIYPLSLVIYFAYRVFAPYKLASLWESRRWFLTALRHTITSPFGRIRFCDSYVADVLTSMVKIIADLAFSLCFYSSGDFKHPHNEGVCQRNNWVFVVICSTLPLWWRFAQNVRLYYDTSKRWPYGGNSLKYALSQAVVVSGSFHPLYHVNFFTSDWDLARGLWFFFCVTSASYSYYWDVVHDFGLWTDQGWMKRKLLYPHVWWYYTAAVIDFFLRFSWTLTITPVDPLLNSTYMPIVIVAELFRRFMWGIFRMEHEQVKQLKFVTKANSKEQAMEKKLHFVPMYFDTKKLTEERKKHANHQSSAFFRECITMIILLFATTYLVATM